jgi:hypothetical protein
MLLKIVKIALCVIVAFAVALVCGCLSGFASLSVSQYFWPMEPDSSFGDGVIPGVMMLSSMVVGFFGSGLIVLRMLLKRLVGWTPRPPSSVPVMMFYPDD